LNPSSFVTQSAIIYRASLVLGCCQESTSELNRQGACFPRTDLGLGRGVGKGGRGGGEGEKAKE
jgi:hypothetical protein